MYQLTIFLYKERYMEDIMMALTAAGLNNTVVIDGLNMENVLAFNVPVFAGLRGELSRSPKFCKVIFTLIEDKSVIEEILESLEEAELNNKKDRIYKIICSEVEVFE